MITDIIYGFPTEIMLEKASSNKITLGVVDYDDNNLEYKCKSCGYEFKGHEKFFKN